MAIAAGGGGAEGALGRGRVAVWVGRRANVGRNILRERRKLPSLAKKTVSLACYTRDLAKLTEQLFQQHCET